MIPGAIPKSLPIVGSGAIGIEFASFYHDMGAEVTVVEVLDRVLLVGDEEISDFARKSFEKQGIKIHTGAAVSALQRTGENVIARIEGGGQGSELAVECIILAVGDRRQCRRHRARRHRRPG